MNTTVSPTDDVALLTAPSVLIVGRDEAAGLGIELVLKEALDCPVSYQHISFKEFAKYPERNRATIVVLRLDEISLQNDTMLAALNRRLPLYVVQGPKSLPALSILMAQRAVAAYVAEDQGLEALGDAITRVIYGSRNLTIGLQGNQAGETSGADTGARQGDNTVLELGEALSRRETQIIREFALGLSMKEIASHFNISPKTVETYKRRAMKKLDCLSRADLLADGQILPLGNLLAADNRLAS